MRFLVPLATSMSGVDGPGGTGKTFLYRALLASIRSMKKIALATSMSGVAAYIQPNGWTFKVQNIDRFRRKPELQCEQTKWTYRTFKNYLINY